MYVSLPFDESESALPYQPPDTVVEAYLGSAPVERTKMPLGKLLIGGIAVQNILVRLEKRKSREPNIDSASA